MHLVWKFILLRRIIIIKEHREQVWRSPVVAGVAAMIRSYYPNLSAKQVKEILLESVEPRAIKVIKPGTKDEKVMFSELSASGGVVNAYKAMQLASKTKGKKKVKNVSKT